MRAAGLRILPSPMRTRILLLVSLLALVGCTHDRAFVRGPASTPRLAADAIDHRLLLIGDAGDPDENGEAALRALARRAGRLGERTTVVFLGDNVYETGMPDASPLEGTVIEEILDEVLLNLYESRQEAERRLLAQVEAVEGTGAVAIFVPGNHDWDQFGIGGWGRVQAQERYLDRLREERGMPVSLLPGGGCPGPVPYPLGERAQLLALDTQWWLELGEKPSPEENPTGCPHVTEQAVAKALTAELARAARDGRHAVVVAHHPLRTRGPHGGFFPWQRHVFPLQMLSSYVPSFTHWVPLPVLGTLMVSVRACCSPNPQDLPGPGYPELIAALEDAMEAAGPAARPLVYAAGHEHSLQVFETERGARFTLVSGLGSSSKASPVGHTDETRFAHSNHDRPGFIQIDFRRDGGARLAVVEWSPITWRPHEVYAREIASGEAGLAAAR